MTRLFSRTLRIHFRHLSPHRARSLVTGCAVDINMKNTNIQESLSGKSKLPDTRGLGVHLSLAKEIIIKLV